ncbi:hypothetical protein [Shewanella sp. HL-SH2]|uniref:hypothetical protein n=1 Tax=Shewanella sp. HL-SH2 TaxID=3436238 RepID=UPI003EB876E7
MNKSIVFGALIIGASVVASPFVIDHIKQADHKEKQDEMAVQLEIAHVIALDNAAILYKDKIGKCPRSTLDLVGVAIKLEPKDRLGLAYETDGNCTFKSFKGITSTSND